MTIRAMMMMPMMTRMMRIEEYPFFIFPELIETQVREPRPRNEPAAIQQVGGIIQPRRSTRSTKGTHSNPYRLPRSAIR